MGDWQRAEWNREAFGLQHHCPSTAVSMWRELEEYRSQQRARYHAGSAAAGGHTDDSSDRDAQIAAVMSRTGCDVAEAVQRLERSNWRVDAASADTTGARAAPTAFGRALSLLSRWRLSIAATTAVLAINYRFGSESAFERFYSEQSGGYNLLSAWRGGNSWFVNLLVGSIARKGEQIWVGSCGYWLSASRALTAICSFLSPFAVPALLANSPV